MEASCLRIALIAWRNLYPRRIRLHQKRPVGRRMYVQIGMPYEDNSDASQLKYPFLRVSSIPSFFPPQWPALLQARA